MQLTVESLPFYQKLKTIIDRYQKEKPWRLQLIRYEGLLGDKIEELKKEESCTAETAKLALYLSEHAVPSTQIHYPHDDERRIRGIVRFLQDQPLTLDEDELALIFHVVQDAGLQIRRFHNFQLDKGVFPSIASIRVAYAYILPLIRFLQASFQLGDLTWAMALIDHAVAQEIPDKSLDLMKQFYGTGNLSDEHLFDAALLIAARQARVINRAPNTSVPITYKEKSQSLMMLKWGRKRYWGSYPTSLSRDSRLPSDVALNGFEYLNFEHVTGRDRETLITLAHGDKHGNTIMFKIKSPVDDFNTTYMKICMEVVSPHLKGLENGRGVETIVNLAESENASIRAEVEIVEEREETYTREELIPVSSSSSRVSQQPQPSSFFDKIASFFKRLLGRKEPSEEAAAKPSKRIVKEKVKRREVRKVKIPPLENFLHLWAESFLIDAISNVHVELPVDIWKEGNYEIESVFVEESGVITDFKDDAEKSSLVKNLLSQAEKVRNLDAQLFRIPRDALEEGKLFLTQAIVQHQDEPHLLLVQPSDGRTVGILARNAFTAKWSEQHVKRVTLERHLKEFTKHLKITRFDDAMKRVFSDYL